MMIRTQKRYAAQGRKNSPISPAIYTFIHAGIIVLKKHGSLMPCFFHDFEMRKRGMYCETCTNTPWRK